MVDDVLDELWTQMGVLAVVFTARVELDADGEKVVRPVL